MVFLKEKMINEQAPTHFERGGDPLRRMDIGMGKYLYGENFYDNKKNVTYLRNRPEDPRGNFPYRAVLYQDPQYKDQWVLRIEQYFYNENTSDEGWRGTPGSWFLSTLLGEDKVGLRHGQRIGGFILIDAGQNWGVGNMTKVLEEAEIIRDTYKENKDEDMNESLNEAEKQVFYVKSLQDGEYGIFNGANELILRGERENISQQLAQASGMRLIEAISIIEQLDKGRAHVSVILNPYFLRESKLKRSEYTMPLLRE